MNESKPTDDSFTGVVRILSELTNEENMSLTVGNIFHNQSTKEIVLIYQTIFMDFWYNSHLHRRLLDYSSEMYFLEV